MASGNCAFVTRNVEIFFSCSKETNLSISGYMIGSPTSESAQCFGSIPSASRSGNTPGTPFICLIMPLCSFIAPFTRVTASSIFQRHVRPTGLVWCRQQNTHLVSEKKRVSREWHQVPCMPRCMDKQSPASVKQSNCAVCSDYVAMGSPTGKQPVSPDLGNKTHLFAHAKLGVVSMHRWLSIP